MARSKSKSIQPRVLISFEDGARGARELPLVVGVLGDFSGSKPRAELPRLRDREFAKVDRSNFDQVMTRISPRVTCRVDNKLVDDRSQLAVDLQFSTLDDFSPDAVARQVEPLRRLLETRATLQKLRERIADDREVGGRFRSAIDAAAARSVAARQPSE